MLSVAVSSVLCPFRFVSALIAVSSAPKSSKILFREIEVTSRKKERNREGNIKQHGGTERNIADSFFAGSGKFLARLTLSLKNPRRGGFQVSL